ncbi:MAG TPA: glycine/sarcosine/betaine reductase selenoprotein B family protein [Terriglobales bacterium]|nr:glycine/sarcosine/betaine reductase selenoprotein B family protein [Terriglobales bacterium]
MPFSYVQFMTELMAPRPYPRQPNFEPPRLTPLRKPIARSTIAIFTSAGIQLRSDPPLAETNDLSYRLIDRAVPYSELTVAHQTPVRVWALEDLNVAFPRERFVELESEGVIGRLAPRAVSMVGSITRFTELLEQTVPAIQRELEEQGVDLLFLFPF